MEQREEARVGGARQLAAHAHAVMGAEIPRDLERLMRTLLFDYLAVAGGGVPLPSSRAVRRAVVVADSRSDDRPSRVLGTEGYAAPADAAFVAGTVGHGLEMDDTFEQASSHPGTVVLPAVNAVAAATGASWDTAMRAAIAGYDVMCAVGVQLGAAESYGRGFHPTGVTGALGAAAAAALLLGLDEQQTTMAISLAANTAAGSLEFLSDGSWTKRLNAGNAAAVGVRAAVLASTDFLGPETALEGRDGFLTQYGRGVLRPLVLELGAGARETSIKFYPCCRYMHGVMDLLREVHAEIPDAALRASSVDVAVIEAGAALVSNPPERKLVIATPVDAQFSMPFGAALALTTGAAKAEQFSRAPELAADLGELMAKVTCVRSEALEAAYPAEWQAEVRVTLDDGTVVEKRENAFVGAPNNRASDDEIRAKASDLVGRDAADVLWALTQELRPDSDFAGEYLEAVYELFVDGALVAAGGE